MCVIKVLNEGKNLFTEKNKINRSLKLVINKECLNIICSIIPDGARPPKVDKLLKEQKENIHITARMFYDLFKSLIEMGENIYKYSHAYYQVDDVEDELENRFLQARKQYKEKNVNEDVLINCISNDDFSEVIEIIDIIYELYESSNILYKVQDLYYVKDEIIDSLRNILDEETLDKYKKRYEQLLMQRPFNFDEMEIFLSKLQQIILNDWKTKITDINHYVPGNPFKFIIHSTCNTNFNGKFFTRLVSNSLITEEFNDTYRAGFGFILPPANIIGASYKDLYINNDAVSNQECVLGTSIPTILSIDLILDYCRKEQENNKRNNIKKRILSEIIIRDFNPQAIFCLTDGSKTLSNEFISAQKLKNSFPNLPIVDIDLTLYKTGDELIPVKIKLIENILSKIGLNVKKITEDEVEDYNLFWNNYMKLKSTENYDEKSIIKLFLETTKLLDSKIDGMYITRCNFTLDEIKYIVNFNSNFRLKDIENGRISKEGLKKLIENLSYINDDNFLDKIYPGLLTFYNIISKIEITDNLVNTINEIADLTLINDLLVNVYKVKYEGKESLQALINNLHSYKHKTIALERLYKSLLVINYPEEEYDKYPGLNVFMLLYPNVTLDIDTRQKIDSCDYFDFEKINSLLVERVKLQELDIEAKIEVCQAQREIIFQEYNKKRELYDKNEMAHYVMSLEEKYRSSYQECQKIKEQLLGLKIQLLNYKTGLEFDGSIVVNSMIRKLEEKIQLLYQDRDIIKENFSMYTGIPFDSYMSKLIEMKEFTKTVYMSDIADDLSRLKTNLTQIDAFIEKLLKTKQKNIKLLSKTKCY